MANENSVVLVSGITIGRKAVWENGELKEEERILLTVNEGKAHQLGGKWGPGEGALEAMLRELFEEASLPPPLFDFLKAMIRTRTSGGPDLFGQEMAFAQLITLLKERVAQECAEKPDKSADEIERKFFGCLKALGIDDLRESDPEKLAAAITEKAKDIMGGKRQNPIDIIRNLVRAQQKVMPVLLKIAQKIQAQDPNVLKWAREGDRDVLIYGYQEELEPEEFDALIDLLKWMKAFGLSLEDLDFLSLTASEVLNLSATNPPIQFLNYTVETNARIAINGDREMDGMPQPAAYTAPHINLILDFDHTVFPHTQEIWGEFRECFAEAAVALANKELTLEEAHQINDDALVGGTTSYNAFSGYGVDADALRAKAFELFIERLRNKCDPHHNAFDRSFAGSLIEQGKTIRAFLEQYPNCNAVILSDAQRNFIRAGLELMGISDLFPDRRIVAIEDTGGVLKSESDKGVRIACERLGVHLESVKAGRSGKVFMVDDNIQNLRHAENMGITTVHIGGEESQEGPEDDANFQTLGGFFYAVLTEAAERNSRPDTPDIIVLHGNSGAGKGATGDILARDYGYKVIPAGLYLKERMKFALLLKNNSGLCPEFVDRLVDGTEKGEPLSKYFEEKKIKEFIQELCRAVDDEDAFKKALVKALAEKGKGAPLGALTARDLQAAMAAAIPEKLLAERLKGEIQQCLAAGEKIVVDGPRQQALLEAINQIHEENGGARLDIEVERPDVEPAALDGRVSLPEDRIVIQNDRGIADLGEMIEEIMNAYSALSQYSWHAPAFFQRERLEYYKFAHS